MDPAARNWMWHLTQQCSSCGHRLFQPIICSLLSMLFPAFELQSSTLLGLLSLTGTGDGWPDLCTAAEHPCHCRLENLSSSVQSPCWKSPIWFGKKEVIDQKSLVTSGKSHLGIPVWSQEGQGFDFHLSMSSKAALIYPTLPNPIQPNSTECNPMVSPWSWLEIVQTSVIVLIKTLYFH